MNLKKAIQILKGYIGEEETNLTFNEWQTQIFIAIDKVLETLEELEGQKENEELNFECLEYGDKVELENGDICVYVRRELEGGSIISQELVLINVFTGEERCINEYKDNLEHDRNPSLDIKRFAN